MKRRVRITGAVLLSLSAGCAGNTPWSTPSLPFPAFGGGAAKSPTEKLQEYKSDEPQFAKPSFQNPRASGPEETSLTADMRGAVNSAWAKTKDAVTIEPTVVHAPDPLSLSSPAENVGADVFFASARLHESQGHVAQADEMYQKALAKSPNDLTILVHSARMHDRAGNFDRAEELYRQAISAHPNQSAAYNDLALCLARRNRLAESADYLNRAVQLQGDNVLYRNNLATVLAEMGRNDEALMHLTAAHGAGVGNYNLAYLLHKRGKSQEAVKCLERALEYDPQFAPASQLLATISGRGPASLASTRPPAAPVSNTITATPQWSNATYASAPGPQLPRTLPPVQGATEDWGDAPTPASLPQLLPPVR